MRFSHGLMIGKFLPPHHGHRHVIATAAAECERFSVLLMASTMEYPPMVERAAWLRELVADLPGVSVLTIVDDAPMDYDSDAAWTAHVDLMTVAVARSGDGAPVDAVYSSEQYGAEMARRLGATPVCVDPERDTHPFSAGMFRADPVGCWTDLPAPVRAGLAVRVVLIGAESTGTTTLAVDLAEALRERGGVWERTGCVPEYGREYTEIKFAALQRSDPGAELAQMVWPSSDFELIASEQTRQENEAAAVGSPVLVCDTDALATTVWERRYAGTDVSRRFGAELLPRRDIYLLTDHHGVEFEQDGWRDGEHLRKDMQQWFVDALTDAGHSWFLITGSREQRVDLALRVTDELVRHRLTFRMPSWTIASGHFGAGAGAGAGAGQRGQG